MLKSLWTYLVSKVVSQSSNLKGDLKGSLKEGRKLKLPHKTPHVITSIIGFLILLSGQNCTQSKFNNGGTILESQSSDVTEDELFYKIQNGTATIAELGYSQDRYRDYLEEMVSDVNSSGSSTNQAGSNNQVPIREVITQLVQDIGQTINELKILIFENKVATNSGEVLKKYSILVDLLSRARDINNYLILKSDIGGVRIDISGLRKDFTALQSSLEEVRNEIIPKLRSDMTKNLEDTKATLQADAASQKADLEKSLGNTEKYLKELIATKETNLRTQLSSTQTNILDQMKAGNKKSLDELNAAYSKLQDQMSDQDKSLREKLNNEYSVLTANMDAQKKQLVNQILDGNAGIQKQLDQQKSDMADLDANLQKQLGKAEVEIYNQMKSGNKNLLDKLNSQHNALNSLISDKDRAQKAALEELAAKHVRLTESQQLLRVNLNARIADVMSGMSEQDKMLREKLQNDLNTLNSKLTAQGQLDLERALEPILVNQVLMGEKIKGLQLAEENLRSKLDTTQVSILNEMKNGNKEMLDQLNERYHSLLSLMSETDRSTLDMFRRMQASNQSLSDAQQKLQADLLAKEKALADQMGNKDLALRSDLISKFSYLQSSLDQQGKDLVNQILNAKTELRSEFDQKLANMKQELVDKMDATNKDVQSKISNLEALSSSNLTQIKSIQEVIVVINQKIRDSSSQMSKMSERLSSDISNIQKEMVAAATAGNDAYAQFMTSWNCTEDMIDKKGYTMYGGAFLHLDASVAESCTTSKETILFNICKERYKTLCGECEDYKNPNNCPAWLRLSGRERLQTLMNIRQDVAINFLAQQTRNINAHMVGEPGACHAECLTGISDPTIINALNGNASTSSTPYRCSSESEEIKKCGLYGVAYGLATNDKQLANTIKSVNDNLSYQLASLRVDFEKEKASVATRFGLAQKDVDQKLSTLKKVTETRFLDFAAKMAGVASGTGGQIASELAERSTVLADRAVKLNSAKNDLFQIIADTMGATTDVVKASLGSDVDALVDLMSSGISPSGFQVIASVFQILNPQQNNRPFYDTDLESRIKTSQCSSAVRNTPFTNVVGRDSHELLAMYYMKALVLGTRSSTSATNNAVFFGTTGMVKSSKLQQAVIAANHDYRVNPSEGVAPECLQIVDRWAHEMIMNDARFDKLRNQLVADETFRRFVTILTENTQTLLNRLGMIEATMVAYPGADLEKFSSNTLKIAMQLIKAAVASRRYDLINQEVKALVEEQKQLAEDMGFKEQLDGLINEALNKQAALVGGLKNDIADSARQISNLQNAQNATAAQVNQLQKASLYLAQQCAADPACAGSTKDSVMAAAKTSPLNPEITSYVEARRKLDGIFTPKITGARYTLSGNAQCFGGANTAEGFLSDGAIYATWGPPWAGGCAVNYRAGTSTKDIVLYRATGSAHKIEYQSTRGGAITTVDFRSTSTSYPIKRIVSGSNDQGTFETQVQGLLDPFIGGPAGVNDMITVTPIFVPRSGSEVRGEKITLRMVLYSPLILDFVNVGVPKLLNPMESRVQFDITASGKKDYVGWLPGSQGGLLALDINGNGKIDDGSELFGEFTKMNKENRLAKNGYEALAQYDLNKDGSIDEKDSVYGKLMIWFDRNSNGVAERGELASLKNLEVTSLGLDYIEMPKERQDNEGNKLLYTAKFFGPKNCGASGCNSYDAYFGTAWTQKTVLSSK